MQCFHLIIVTFVLTQSLVKCSMPASDMQSAEFNNLIVNKINDYRGNLMCLKHVIGLKYISKSAILTKAAEDILSNKRKKDDNNLRLKEITPETCDYKIDSGRKNLHIIEYFIKSCTNETNVNGNLKLIWLWNPSITTIGCAFKKHGTFVIFCVVNEVDEKIDLEEQSNLLAKAKSTNDLYTGPCRRKKLDNHNQIMKCFFRQESRDLIIKELNTMRNGLAVQRRFTNIKYVEWDYDLEKTAIELRQFNINEIRKSNCSITKKFKSTYPWYPYKQGYSNMTSDLYIDLIPNWLKKEKESIIAESEDPSNITRTYGWTYDAEFHAIGCTLFKLANDVHILCLTNRDPERNFNLLKGKRFCLDCECRNMQYPYLCTPKSDAIDLKYYDMYIIFGSIILIYASIIGVIIFIRSVWFFEKQQLLFESDY